MRAVRVRYEILKCCTHGAQSFLDYPQGGLLEQEGNFNEAFGRGGQVITPENLFSWFGQVVVQHLMFMLVWQN